MAAKKFTIYGSCVTRDIFNFLDNELFCPEITINFNPIYSLFSEPIPLDCNILYENIDERVSNFTKRMIYYNFSKIAKNKILESEGEWFIFDLGSERLPLQTWEIFKRRTNIPVTWETYRMSQNLKEKECFKDLKIMNWRLPNYKSSSWIDYIKQFCNLILSKYDPHKIIYISLQQCEEIIDESMSNVLSFTSNKFELPCFAENRKIREKQNTIIQDAEKTILNQIPDCYVINLPDYILSNVRHHFCSHPLHFDYLFYEYAAEAIRLIVKDDGYEQRNRKIVEKNLSNLRVNYSDKFYKLRALIGKANRLRIQFWGGEELKNIFDSIPDFSIDNAICGVSVSTLFSEKVSMQLEERGLDSKAIRFLNDCNKIYIDKINNSRSSWIIIDLLSEFKDRVQFLNSEGKLVEIMADYPDKYFDLLKQKGNSNFQICKGIENFDWNKLKNFLNMIKNIWIEQNIIVNEFYFCEYYINDEGEINTYGETVKNMNSQLKEKYEYLYRLLPNCKKIVTLPNRVSYISDNPSYISDDLYTFYRRSMQAVINDDEKLLIELLCEQRKKDQKLKRIFETFV